LYTLVIYVLPLYALANHTVALDVVYNILNMQRYGTSVAGQACSYSKAAKGGSQHLCLNENFHCYDIGKYRTDTASLAWPTSRVGETCYESRVARLAFLGPNL